MHARDQVREKLLQPAPPPPSTSRKASSAEEPRRKANATLLRDWSGKGWGRGKKGWGTDQEWGGGEEDPAVAETSGLHSVLKDIIKGRGSYGKPGRTVRRSTFGVDDPVGDNIDHASMPSMEEMAKSSPRKKSGKNALCVSGCCYCVLYIPPKEVEEALQNPLTLTLTLILIGGRGGLCRTYRGYGQNDSRLVSEEGLLVEQHTHCSIQNIR